MTVACLRIHSVSSSHDAVHRLIAEHMVAPVSAAVR